jgi:lipoprotein-anchoring transpeptidase ErfK/SrfK
MAVARRLLTTTTIAAAALAPQAAAQTPATGALTLTTSSVGKAQGKRLALQGDKVAVAGTLTPFVAGQRVVVRLRQSGKTVGRKVVRIADAGNGTGVFRARLRLKRSGFTNVQAFHEGSPLLAATAAPPVPLTVAAPALTYGSRGPLVQLLQRRLRALRFAVTASGVYGDRTARGVIAWRKINGMARLGSADATVIRRVLAKKGGWKVRHPKAGRHVEADVSQGVLALVQGKRVVRTYHTSPGAPSTPTIIGKFRFYLKTIGTNNVGMVDSSYFIRGYAIHGYHSVPVFNASHGCLRVPIPDARYIYDWIRIGDRIFVEP